MKSGEWKWIRARGKVVKRDAEGNAERMSGTHTDISIQKAAEEKLKASEELFSNAFQAGPSGLTITRTCDGTFIDVNKSFLEMFEYTREEVIGHTSVELKIWSTEERESLIEQQVKTGGLSNFEMKANAKSGRIVNILFSSRPMTIKGEKCHLTTMIDITEKKKAEEYARKKDLEFRRLSSHLPDLIFQFTRRPDGTYCVPIASDGIRNIFGCTPEEVVDDFDPIAKVIHPDDIERVIQDIEYSAANLTYFTCEFRVVIPG